MNTDESSQLLQAGPDTQYTATEDDASTAEGVSKPNCCRRLRDRLFPLGFWPECKALCKLAVPIVLTSVVTFMFGPISLAFCGHLGKTNLAAVGLAISVFNVTGVAIITGLLTACDTLFSQTFGGEDKLKMGVQLQRALILITLCCFPCWAIHLLVEPILLGAQQNPKIAILVSRYLIFMMPGLWNRVVGPLIIGVTGNCINALLHYIFLYQVKTGIDGSAIAQSIGYCCQLLGALGYVRWSGVLKTTWRGYAKEMWLDWGIWFKLAIPGLAMTGLEWWIFEFGTIAAGVVGEKELAVQTIMFNVQSLSYTLLPLGLGIAASIRVGQGLGAQNELRPITTTSVTMVMVCFASVINSLIFLALRYDLPKLFTSDSSVIELTTEVIPCLVVFQLFDTFVVHLWWLMEPFDLNVAKSEKVSTTDFS